MSSTEGIYSLKIHHTLIYECTRNLVNFFFTKAYSENERVDIHEEKK